jgi:hypothetical protein
MSATGRNLVGRERLPDDFYQTPAWCVRAILPHLTGVSAVLDPCCGNGAILDVVADEWKCITTGIELDPVREVNHLATRGDALRMRWPEATVITNPPYSLAFEFVCKSIFTDDDPPLVSRRESAFLLRLNWLGSMKRYAFHRIMPADLYVLPRRPSFAHGGTDATEYAWFVWGPHRGGRWQILEVE